MHDRIIDLEIQLTHQQCQVEELNERVYFQEQTLNLLSAELRRVKEQLQIVLPSLAREPEEETLPPHY